MKSLKSVLTKSACMLAFILVTNSFSKTQAQVQLNYVATVDTAGDIRFIKAEDNVLVFELNLKNLPVSGSTLNITDETGNLIFEKGIKTATYQMRYKIERSNLSKIIFEVSGKKFLLNRAFSINTWTEEKISVAKL